MTVPIFSHLPAPAPRERDGRARRPAPTNPWLVNMNTTRPAAWKGRGVLCRRFPPSCRTETQASRRVSTRQAGELDNGIRCRHEWRHGTQGCVRHKPNSKQVMLQRPKLNWDKSATCRGPGTACCQLPCPYDLHSQIPGSNSSTRARSARGIRANPHFSPPDGRSTP